MSALGTPPANGPRNLAPYIGEWLRKIGFTATEQVLPGVTILAAHWDAPGRTRFYLEYTHSSGTLADATCCLWVRKPSGGLSVLFKNQQVHRLKQLRELLLGNVRYKEARAAASASVPAGS